MTHTKAARIAFAAQTAYQSDFAKRYVAQGRAEVIVRQLTLRFGPLPAAAQARIAEASLAELNAIAERLLTAQTLLEALGS